MIFDKDAGPHLESIFSLGDSIVPEAIIEARQVENFYAQATP